MVRVRHPPPIKITITIKMMKKLTLQINKESFQNILKGEQKVEHRNVYPTNAKRYVIETESKDENGELLVDVKPVHYDALVLINGRRKDAPRLTVKVVKSEFVILTDENGEDLTFEENGSEYYVCQVWYTLGEIIETENVAE